MDHFKDVTRDQFGNIRPNITISVYNAGTSNLATIFSDNSSTAKGNPFSSDSDGKYNFYAVNGRYDVVLNDGVNAPVTCSDIVLNDSSVSGGGGASSFDELSDVDVASAANGNLLMFNGTEWVPSTAGSSTTNLSVGNINLNTLDVLSSSGTDATLPPANTNTAGLMSGADKTKLDTIEGGATADQTGSQIKALYEAEADTNALTDSLVSKIASIEVGATADQSSAEIKTAYESNSNTNAFTDAQQTKLNAITGTNTGDETDGSVKTKYEANADTNAFTDAEKTKLAGLDDEHFKGKYTSLSALNIAHPTALDGDYAYVDPGTGTDAEEYIWDSDDAQWVSGGATGAETPASLKSKYESNADTNAFTDAEQTKLSGIEANATADQTGVELVASIDTQLGSASWQSGGGASNADAANAMPHTPPTATNSGDDYTIPGTTDQPTPANYASVTDTGRYFVYVAAADNSDAGNTQVQLGGLGLIPLYERDGTTPANEKTVAGNVPNAFKIISAGAAPTTRAVVASIGAPSANVENAVTNTPPVANNSGDDFTVTITADQPEPASYASVQDTGKFFVYLPNSDNSDSGNTRIRLGSLALIPLYERDGTTPAREKSVAANVPNGFQIVSAGSAPTVRAVVASVGVSNQYIPNVAPTTTGTEPAYEVATNSLQISGADRQAGDQIQFKIHATNTTTAATLNVDGVGAANFRALNTLGAKVPMPIGALPIGQYVSAEWDGTEYVLLGARLPGRTIIEFPAATASQTVFSDAAIETTSVVDVFQQGLRLRTSQYTVNAGNITLSSGATVSDLVDVIIHL